MRPANVEKLQLQLVGVPADALVVQNGYRGQFRAINYAPEEPASVTAVKQNGSINFLLAWWPA